MPRYRVAHIKQRDVNLIIIPLDPAFGRKSDQEKHTAINELQARSFAARLAGTVVPVWPVGSSMGYMAPSGCHPFFNSLTLAAVRASLNKEIYW
jgi:hypothetical protein